MAATQFITAVYDKIWDLLEAHTPFTDVVRVGNRLDFTTGKSITKRYAVSGKAPADFPEVSLELGDAVGQIWGAGHYGMRNPATAATSIPGTETLTQEYTLEILTDDKRVTAEQLVYMEALTALRKGGPRWGFAYVKRWGFPQYRVTRSVEATDDTGRVLRPVTRLVIPVEFQLDVQSLLT